jgi:hypothetical protein
MPQIRLAKWEADGDLPMVCMSCSEPAVVTVVKKMAWYPPWVAVLLFGMGPGAILYLIVAFMLTRHAQLRAPFCDRHKGHWSNRDAYTWGTFLFFSFLVGIGLIVSFSQPVPMRGDFFSFVGFGACIMFVVWVIIVIVVHNTGIRAKEITETNILLKGVSASFVEAVEEADRQRRLRKLEHWEDDEDELLSHKRPTTDAIEEERRLRNTLADDAFEE